MTHQTLYRLYAAERGHAPYQALCRIRFEAACERLAPTAQKPSKHAIQSAACACGYTRVSTFSRWFRAHCGMSPT